MSTITTTNRKNGTTPRQSEPKATARVEVTPDDIRCRAHEIFCNRNGAGGDHVSDWLQAEQELTGVLGGRSEPIEDRSSERHEARDRPEIMSQMRGERLVNA